MFSCFGQILTYDRQTDERTQDHEIYCSCTVFHGKTTSSHLTKFSVHVVWGRGLVSRQSIRFVVSASWMTSHYTVNAHISANRSQTTLFGWYCQVVHWGRSLLFPTASFCDGTLRGNRTWPTEWHHRHLAVCVCVCVWTLVCEIQSRISDTLVLQSACRRLAPTPQCVQPSPVTHTHTHTDT